MYITLKLYKLQRKNHGSFVFPDKIWDYDLILEKSSPLGLFKDLKNWQQNFFFYAFSKKKYLKLRLFKNGEEAHYSYVSYKSYRFPFMRESDIMIGPCYTFDNFRRNGLYLKTLETIINNFPNECFWIFAHENNLPSLRVIEKAGFEFYGDVSMNKLTKKLKVV